MATTWSKAQLLELFELPFFELISQAHACHKANFDIQEIELCALSSIKTGTCPEDCSYCSQSGHYKTGLQKQALLDLDTVLLQAKQAQAKGAKRFCMGAAWRNPPKKDFPKVLAMITAVKAMGMETCVTLGMLDAEHAQQLKAAGLDFYNHNIDTSPEYYPSITTTRTFADRINTLKCVAEADIEVCCGGIMGLGESRDDRIEFLLALQALPSTPKSIPINSLIPAPGTPLANMQPLDTFEFIKMIAIARLMFPKSMVRLSAGREKMSDEMQAWCFMAGANSIFIGEKLLTLKNPEQSRDMQLLQKLKIRTPQLDVELDHAE